ncbi:hypothetical protein GF325_10820 [Candidatus Bathyarchaeota archaeon]|nr:hypothetical protein [Candidatus Bathyarchaeota archaeon]
MNEKESTERSNLPRWSSPITPQYLTRFNKLMALLHLAQGIMMFFLGTLLDFEVSLFTYYTDFTGVGSGIPPTLNPEIAFTITNVGAWVGLFLLMSAIAHFLLAWPLNKRYIDNLKMGRNPLRFLEYAFSSSVMIVLIGIFFTITNVWTLFAMFVLNFLMNLFGLNMEYRNPTNDPGVKIDWKPYIFGCIAGLAPWVVITGYFIGAEGTPPAFVYGIFIVEAVLFNCFALVMLAYFKRWGRFKDYAFGERAYQLLSLIAKTLLAWLVFGGIFQPS